MFSPSPFSGYEIKRKEKEKRAENQGLFMALVKRLLFILRKAAEKCSDNFREISIVVYHPLHLVPHLIKTTDGEQCIGVTRSEIHPQHVTLHFRELLIGTRICAHVVYVLNPERPLQLGGVVKGWIEVSYTTTEKGIQKEKNVRKKFSSNLKEFPGYIIKNVELGCCIASPPQNQELKCVPNQRRCLVVKEDNNRLFTPQHNCFTYQTDKKGENPTPEIHPCTDRTDSQIFEWSQNRIMSPRDDAEKKFLRVSDDLKTLEFSPSWRSNEGRAQFRQVHVVTSPRKKRAECFLKDVVFKGVVMATKKSVASWEKCSVECWENRTCAVWTWFTPDHLNSTLREACVLRSLVMSDGGTGTRFVPGTISGNVTCVKKVGRKSPVSSQTPADVSVLELNKKLYFCSYVENDDRSACFMHHMLTVAVSKIPARIVALLGGDPYSNTLYGHNAKGQVMKLSPKDKGAYTLLSAAAFDKVMTKTHFVRSKSYNRTQLFYKNMTDEFVVDGRSYGITYYGLFNQSSQSNIAIWLPEAECTLKAASSKHIAATSCGEVCIYSVSYCLLFDFFPSRVDLVVLCVPVLYV